MRPSLSVLLLVIPLFSASAQDGETLVLIPKNRAEKTKFQEIHASEAIGHINSKVSLSQAWKQKKLSVLVWNIYKGVKKKIHSEFPIIASKYDLLILQEAYTTPDMLKMFETTSHRFTLAGSFIYKPQEVKTGVATGSKIRPVKETPIQSKYKEPIVDSTQMCLASEFTVDGLSEKLLVINVHAIVFVPSEKLFDQLDQFKTIIEKHKGPVILAGDFNTWDESKLKYLKRIAKHLGLSQSDYTPDIRRKFKNYPLDHLYYRGLILEYARVLDMGQLSDHNPIEAGFKLP